MFVWLHKAKMLDKYVHKKYPCNGIFSIKSGDAVNSNVRLDPIIEFLSSSAHTPRLNTHYSTRSRTFWLVLTYLSFFTPYT